MSSSRTNLTILTLSSKLAAGWVLVLLGLVISGILPTVALAQNPQSGDIELSGNVSGVAPLGPAVITQPANGQHFSSNQITVIGTCPTNGAYVHIFRNDVFAGSAPCIGGEFSLVITLLPGENRLIARVFSADNQPGPDSATVTVFYDVPAGAPPVSTTVGVGVQPLLVLTEPFYPGGYVQKQLQISIEILGGEGPYAISIDWGDGTNDLLVRESPDKFMQGHAYTEAGTYEVKIAVSDVSNRKASIQTVTIVSGEPAKLELDTFIEKHSKSIWVRIIGPLFLVVIVYVAGLVTGLKIVGDELKQP